MSEALSIRLGSPLPLSWTAPDGASGLFPRAVVYDTADAVVATRDLTEVGATGRYTDAGFTPGAVGEFIAHFIAYTNSGHTTESNFYERDQDSFAVDVAGSTSSAIADAVLEELISDHSSVAGSLAEGIALIKGLSQENYVLDNTTFDSVNLLLTGRVRVFASAAAANLAADGAADDADSEVFRFSVNTVAATAGQPDIYKFIRTL